MTLEELSKRNAAAGQQAATPQNVQQITPLQQQQAATVRALEIERIYQRNILHSGTLQAEIIKGAQNGEAASSLLLKACAAIDAMTGNAVMFEQVSKALQERQNPEQE